MGTSTDKGKWKMTVVPTLRTIGEGQEDDDEPSARVQLA